MCRFFTMAEERREPEKTGRRGNLPYNRISEGLLMCKICYGKFSAEYKMPKLLSCSHTFCEHCVAQFTLKCHRQRGDPNWEAKGNCGRPLYEEKFPCPLCRKVTVLPEKGVTALVNNVTVLELLEIFNRQMTMEPTPKKTTVPRQSSLGQYEGIQFHDQPSGGSLSRGAIPKREGILSNTHHSSIRSRKENFTCAMCIKRYELTENSKLTCGHCLCKSCRAHNSVASLHPGGSIICPVCGSETMNTEKGILRFHPTGSVEHRVTFKGKHGIVYPDDEFDAMVKTNANAVSPMSSGSDNGESRPPPFNPEYHKGSAPAEIPFYGAHPLVTTSLPRSRDKGSTIVANQVPSTGKPPVPPRRYSMSPKKSPVQRSKYDHLKRQNTDPQPSAPEDPDEILALEVVQPNPRKGPKPPPRTSPPESPPSGSPVKLIKKVGKYSEVKLQTNTFREPSTVAASTRGDIVVVDSQHMTVQIFSQQGEYISMFKVLGVQAASFISEDKLAVATHRGVEIFTASGDKVKELPIGHVNATTPFLFGFAACKNKNIVIYRHSLTQPKEINKRKYQKPCRFKKSVPFDNLKDIAATSSKDLVVLDAGQGEVYVIDEEGNTKILITPEKEACGKLKEPSGVAVDRTNNILISDTGNHRVLKFNANGTFARCLLNFAVGASTSTSPHLYPSGLCVSDSNTLILVLSGNEFAEVRMYQLVDS